MLISNGHIRLFTIGCGNFCISSPFTFNTEIGILGSETTVKSNEVVEANRTLAFDFFI